MADQDADLAEKCLSFAEHSAAELKNNAGENNPLCLLGAASVNRSVWPAEDIQRALGVVAEYSRWKNATLDDVLVLYSEGSNLGDECGAHLVPFANIAHNVFDDWNLIARIGPLTLKALLEAGANPNCATASGTPLARVLYPTYTIPRYRMIHMAAILIAAGADPVGIAHDKKIAVPFQQLCDLRSLSAFYSCREPEYHSSPAVRFVALDGDLAIAHRVHEFLAPRELFTSQ
jgi:hypothetical protein